MAEEKDTDSAPDDGVTESDAVTPSPRHGIGPTGPDARDDSPEDDALDDQQSAEDPAADDADDQAADADGDAELGVPAELRDAESEGASEADEVGEDSDDERELVGVGAAAKSGRSGSVSGDRSVKPAGRAKKDRPTPKQRTEVDKPKRTTPLEFVRGAISELKKVVYPTGSQLANYFVVVLVFVLLVIAIVTALDYGFGWAMLKVFS